MRLRIGILVLLCLSAAASMAQAVTWKKHVAADKSYSFHYPSGWTVRPTDSIVEVSSPAASDEQLLLIAVSGGEAKPPRQLAESAIAQFKGAYPDLVASNWQSAPGADASIIGFDIAYSNGGKSYQGVSMVLKAGDTAHWFVYSGPSEGYSRTRGAGLLQGFISSLARGDASNPPAAPVLAKPDAEKLRRNSQAFLFVIEFALGAPLTSEQEQLILREVKNAWAGESAAELQKYDAYPGIVNAILSMSQADLGKLQSQLSASMNEWIEQTDQSNPAVAAVKAALAKRGNVLIEGNPPLTEMAAVAYSELIAYSELLHKNSKAGVDKISSASVSKIRGQLLNVWSSFSAEERANVATAPGLWMVMRTLMSHGTPDQVAKTRSQIKGLTNAPQPPPAKAASGKSGSSVKGSSSGKSSSGGNAAVRRLARHVIFTNMLKDNRNPFEWKDGFSRIW